MPVLPMVAHARDAGLESVAGRPPLRIGQHGKISRKYLGNGVWKARCRYRDTDGVTRLVQRRGPADEYDHHGKVAEDALIESLPTADHRPTRLTSTQRSDVGSRRTLTGSPRTDAHTQPWTRTVGGGELANLGGLRIGEATPARIDAALRSMPNTHGPGMARHAKTILRGALQLAVMAGVLAANPVRDVAVIKSKRPRRAPPR